MIYDTCIIGFSIPLLIRQAFSIYSPYKYEIGTLPPQAHQRCYFYHKSKLERVIVVVVVVKFVKEPGSDDNVIPV